MKKKSLALGTALIMLLSLMLVLLPIRSSAATANFVYRDGTNFMLNGQSFYYAGSNLYYLGLTPDQTRVNNLLQGFQNKGVKVLRIWAFNNRPDDGIQTSLGVYNETRFRELDYAVAKARDYGIRVILTMVNNWNDYNGMQWYVDQRLGSGQPHYKFYSDSSVKQDFKNYVSTLLNRTNYYTGQQYKNDPYVFAWELANEPRNTSYTTNDNGDMMLNWINEMGAYIKGIDPNHMLTTGEEGFRYNTSGSSSYPDSGYDKTDFARNILSSYVDFATIHVYPQHWGGLDDNWVNYYLNDRADLAHNVANKPIVMEEYGVETSDTTFGGRDARFTKWQQYASAADFDGTMVWQMEDFTNTSFSFDFSTSTATVIQNMAGVQNLKSGTTVLNDNLNDYSKMYSHSANLNFDNGNTQNFKGDTSRLNRTSSTYENIVYNTPGDMKFMNIDTYFWPTEGVTDFNFYRSSDGTNYTAFTPDKNQIGGEWNRIKYTYNSFPAGTKYLKIEFRNTSVNYWNPQISNVKILHTGGGGGTTPTPTPTPTPSTGSIDVTNTSTNGSSFGRNDTDQKKRFQTFVATGLNKITKVEVRVKADNGVPSNMTAELYATSGGKPTGSALASALVSGSSIGSSFGTVTVPLTYTGLVSGTKYAIVLSQATLSNNTFYEWAVAPVDSSLEFGMYTGSTWLDNSSVGDGSTKIFVSN
jgi:hypothetical protein